MTQIRRRRRAHEETLSTRTDEDLKQLAGTLARYNAAWESAGDRLSPG